MQFIAVTPVSGSLIHALELPEVGKPSEVDGRLIQKSACGLRKPLGFQRLGGTDQDFDTVEGFRCVRCVRSVALSRATSDEERDQIERAYRSGALQASA